MDGMKKSFAYFTDEKLKELAQNPNTTVMVPDHKIKFTPLPSDKVNSAVDRIVDIVKLHGDDYEKVGEIVFSDFELGEFAGKYTHMFKKLTEPSFIKDQQNVQVVKQLIRLWSETETHQIDAQAAQAEASDIALKSLVSRVASKASSKSKSAADKLLTDTSSVV